MQLAAMFPFSLEGILEEHHLQMLHDMQVVVGLHGIAQDVVHALERLRIQTSMLREYY